MNKDTKKAAAILIGWAVLSFLALGIKNAAVSVFVITVLTFVTFLIFYSSWLIEREQKRAERYIENQREILRRSCGDEVSEN